MLSCWILHSALQTAAKCLLGLLGVQMRAMRARSKRKGVTEANYDEAEADSVGHKFSQPQFGLCL